MRISSVGDWFNMGVEVRGCTPSEERKGCKGCTDHDETAGCMSYAVRFTLGNIHLSVQVDTEAQFAAS